MDESLHNDNQESRSPQEIRASAVVIDIIWNVTPLCGWDCATCCVSALQVTQKDGQVLISSPELDRVEAIPRDRHLGNIYDQALKHRQALGLELTLEQKEVILDHLAGHPIRLDISGGDALSPRENYTVLQSAASRFGRAWITLTATGAGLAGYDTPSIAPYIGELNFTFDGEPDLENPLRPASYAAGNLRKAKKFADGGVITRAECPLSVQNLEPKHLVLLYEQLHNAGIDKLLLMRLFPVGRGSLVTDAIPTVQQYRRAITTLRELEARYNTPEVKLQCALRHLERPTEVNPCDALTESFGLTWNGTLLGSPWAINKAGKPIDDAWVLGCLIEQTLTEILESERVMRMRARAAKNHGHCKIFSWLHGNSDRSEDRIFENADPMYASPQYILGGAV